MLHVGWFLTFRTPVWRFGMSGDAGRSWPTGRFHTEMARALDRAKFDFMMIEDSSKVPDAYGGTFEMDLKHGRFAPKHDPFPLIPYLTSATDNLGVIATASTTFYPPFIVARLLATLSHLTGGRVGWNMVTSSGDRAAQNFGLDELHDHDLRYAMANEFAEVVRQLWESWEPDALTMDRETGTYVDWTKVHEIDFVGKFHKVRGPLNTLPPLGGNPIRCQAGASDAGRDFGARHAEVVLGDARGTTGRRTYRDDVRARAARAGRDPDDVKVMFGLHPIVAGTEREAWAKAEVELHPDDYDLEECLDILSAHGEIDFAAFDVDAPLPPVSSNHHQSQIANLAQFGSTVREIATNWWRSSVDETLVGTPDQVAERIGEMYEEIGGDGFYVVQRSITRDYVLDIADGLMPALQRAGLTRREYTSSTLRGHVTEF